MKKLTLFFPLFFLPTMICLSQSAKEFYDNAKELYDAAKYDKSIEEVNKAIAIDSMNAGFFDLKGRCYVELKLYMESFDAFNKAVKLAPNEEYVYANRSNLFLVAGELDLAMNDIEVAITLARKDTLKYQLIGQKGLIYTYQQEYKKAYETYKIAYNFNPNDVPVLMNLSSVCGRLERQGESLDYLFTAHKISPEDYGVLSNLGFQLQQGGDYKSSIEYIDKALKISPDNAVMFNNRGYSKLKLGDLKGAMKDVNYSLKINPENSYAYRNRALIYLELNNKKEACADLETAASKGFKKFYGNEVDELTKAHCKD